MSENPQYSYHEDDEVWELYLGRTAFSHGIKILKVVKNDPMRACYWPDKEQSERIVTALNNQLEIDKAWAGMVAEQAKPAVPEQEWEHVTSEQEGGRAHHQCPSCKKWVHRCSNCGFFDWREEEYCSENCWKAAGSPSTPDDGEVKSS